MHGGSSGGDPDGPLLAQAIAAQLQPMGVVDDPVEDRVGESRLADQVLPAVDRDLASDQRGAAAVAVLDDFARWLFETMDPVSVD